MSDARFTEEEWQTENGAQFSVVIAGEALEDLYVDGSRRDVKEGEYLIYSGSDSVGYYSFDADQYRGWGCSPVDTAEPAHADTAPADPAPADPAPADPATDQAPPEGQ